MDKIIILILVGFGSVISSDLIIIGDNFMSQIANILLEIPYTKYTENYLNYSYISTNSSKEYEGHNISFSTIYGVNYNFFLNGGHPTFLENIHKQLKNAKNGTNVLINLCGRALFFGYYKWTSIFGKLANKYTKLKFYLISSIGVRPIFSDIHNGHVAQFNQNLKNEINKMELKNFKYKSILYNEDPLVLDINGEAVDMNNYFSSEYSLKKNGLIKLFKAMTEGF